MLRDPRSLALLLAILAASFSYLYAYSNQPGAGYALGASTGMEFNETLKACGFTGSQPVFVVSEPFSSRVIFGDSSFKVSLAPVDACVGEGYAAVAGSWEGRPAVMVARESGAVVYTTPTWGMAVSVDCKGWTVAFAAASYTGELVVGVIPASGGAASAAVIRGFPGNEWSAKASAAPWGAVAVAGDYIVYYNKSSGSVEAYRLEMEGFKASLEGAWAGEGGVIVYGKAQEGDRSLGLIWQVGAPRAFLVDSPSGRSVVKAAAPRGMGVEAYYSPGTWWDGVIYVAKPSERARGVRLIHGYPHIVNRVYVESDGAVTVTVTASNSETRAVCIRLARAAPLRLGPLGGELVTVQYIPVPERPSIVEMPPPSLSPVSLDYDIVNVNSSSLQVRIEKNGGYSLARPQASLLGRFLAALGVSIPAAAAAYWVVSCSLPGARRGPEG